MLTYYKEQGVLIQSVDETVVMTEPNYDNYCFSRSRLVDCMFNSHTGIILFYEVFCFTWGKA